MTSISQAYKTLKQNRKSMILNQNHLWMKRGGNTSERHGCERVANSHLGTGWGSKWAFGFRDFRLTIYRPLITHFAITQAHTITHSIACTKRNLHTCAGDDKKGIRLLEKPLQNPAFMRLTCVLN